MSIKFKDQEFTPREFNDFICDYEDEVDDDFIAEEFEARELECTACGSFEESTEYDKRENYGFDIDKITLVQNMAYDYFIDHMEDISLDDLENIIKLKKNRHKT